MDPVAQAHDALTRVIPGVRADLDRLIRIPSVSADPTASEYLAHSAATVAAMLRGSGLDDVEVLSVPGGKPAVLARRAGPARAPTVLLYAHHDVQPAGDVSAWLTDPFQPVERDGRLHGRGAADDKAGIAVHLAALRVLDRELPLGVVVLVEGEEEIGSPTLSAFLDAYRSRLSADVIVLADSTNWRIGVPALTTSLRGGANVVVEVATLQHAVHNGLYGGAVPDALTVLARLLATLHDANGSVAVDGLSRAESDPLDLSEDRLRADAGVLAGVELVGTGSFTSRLWSGPAISVVGIDAPSVDDAAMSLVPRARAKLTLRIGPQDDAEAARGALIAHLTSHVPWGAQATVTAGTAVRPFRARTAGPAYAAARSAFADAWGVEPVEIGVGGSINFVPVFATSFPDAEILITGVEDPDTRAHSANESLHLADFERACLAEILLLTRLSQTVA